MRQAVLRSRRLTAAQRKVARPYRGRLAMLLPLRVKCQKLVRGRLGRLRARLARLYLRRVVAFQCLWRCRVACLRVRWLRHLNACAAVWQRNWRG